MARRHHTTAANVLFLEGKPCLGDYGLVGEPGDIVDYRGTEGYQPLEGTSATSAGLFLFLRRQNLVVPTVR